MNFKDTYKLMTDEIHGDKVLLHSILNGEAKKDKHFSFFSKPFCTLAFVAMFALASTSLYFKSGINQHNATSEKGITTEDTAKTPPLTAKKAVPQDTSAALCEQTTPKDTYSQNDTADCLKPDTSGTDEAATGAALTEDISGIFPATVSDDNADSAYTQSVYEDKERRMVSGSQSTKENITPDIYWTYLGVDVMQVVSLPEDLTFAVPDVSCINLSNEEDVLTINAASSDENRSVQITVSRKNDFTIENEDAVYVKSNGINYAVSTHNLTEQEINDIILSISK